MLNLFADIAPLNPSNKKTLPMPIKGEDSTIAIIVAAVVIVIAATVVSIILLRKSSKKNGHKSH